MDTPTVVHLRLPAEEQLPLFGSGCCILAPDDAIRAELDGWRDVRTLQVELAQGSVVVELGPQAPPVTRLVAALHGIGIAAVAAA